VPTETPLERVLVVAAHPDDVDFGAAGTIAGWTAAGIEVAYCIITNGDAGGFDPAIPRADIPSIRQAEQRAAAAAVGVTDVTFLGYPDGRLYVTHDLRRDITRQIRRARPQRVLGQSPERNWQRIAPSHPDHLAAGEATLCALYPDARNQFAHPELVLEGLGEWVVGEMWLSGGPRADHFVDVTDTFDKKLAALRAHVSQTEHIEDLEGMLRGWLSLNATRAGMEDGRLAEAFQVVTTA
jgi:LmbE family N-acetylglucosaminyl deacetylase